MSTSTEHAFAAFRKVCGEKVTELTARAERAEAELAEQKWLKESAVKRAKELTAELDGIRALADRRNKRYHVEDTTHQLVAALDQALDIAQAELATEQARLDAVIYDCWIIHKGNENAYAVRSLGEYITPWVATPRAAIDAAMKEGEK